MHSASTTFVNKLKRGHSATSKPTATIEWNMNRFSIPHEIACPGVSADSTDAVFPIDSLVSPRRPTKAAIVKGWTSPGKLGKEAPAKLATELPRLRKMYTAAEDAKYKYWISPKVSASKSVGGSYPLESCFPRVIFKSSSMKANKLVAQFETSGAKPVGVIIQYTEDGSNWVTAYQAVNPDRYGRIELYLQDNGSFSPTKNLNNLRVIKGMRVRVPAMNKPKVHCHMIEMAIMRQMDVTDKLIDYSFDYDNSSASFVAPLGQAETATGTLSLSNVDGYFDNDRPSGPLYGIVSSPAKVEVTLRTTVDGTSVTTPQGSMFVTNWGEQSEDKRTISLEDASCFLKEENPPPLFLSWVKGTEIIWRLLDSVGFTDYSVDDSDAGDLNIRYFWTDPERTVWEHIQEISEAMQISCYFDETGILRIRTRTTVYEKDKSDMDWVFDGQEVTSSVVSTDAGRVSEDIGKLPDIVSMTKPAELEANKVVVEYQATEISDANRMQPKMEQVWEPEGTVALRSATLSHSMTRTQEYGRFADSNFNSWPFEGYMQVDGEIMHWTKKRYKYLQRNNEWKVKWISDNDEKEALDALHPTRSHFNKFDGALWFGEEGRGALSTYPRTHNKVGHKFSAIRSRHGNKPMIQKSYYTKAIPNRSVFRIYTTKAFKGTSWTSARRGLANDAPPRYIGTSLKFDKGSAYSQGSAGLFLGAEGGDAGYYIEISLTAWAGKRRKYTNEVVIYQRSSSGKLTRISKGKAIGVSKGKWYDIDVHQRPSGNTYLLSVMVNGVAVLNNTIPSKLLVDSRMSGSYGIFARGSTHVEFEYLYASNTLEEIPMDDSARFDLIEGGYRSNFYNSLITRKERPSSRLRWRSDKRRNQNEGFFFDDFGTEAHEIRRFNVEFDPLPAVHSRLYLSNEWYADCIEYTSDHKSAEFFVAGKGRRNVILNGSDSTIYGTNDPVEQQMFVYGRTVTQKDAEKYEVKSEKSIRRVGEVELVITSQWIQSEAAAKRIGDWIADHWSNGSEKMEVSTFGNPLLQVGDVVGVCYLRKSMKTTRHQYYITGVSYNYSEGLTTSYRLQRRTHFIA